MKGIIRKDLLSLLICCECMYVLRHISCRMHCSATSHEPGANLIPEMVGRMFHVFMKEHAGCILKSDKIMVEVHLHLILKKRDKNYVLYEQFCNFMKL